jgi:ferredoxin
VICPLGILMDIITRIRNKILKRQKFTYKHPNNILRYSILSLTILFWITGIISFVTLLDPFSIFGRISNTLLLPLYVYTNNILTSSLEFLNVYSLININHNNATLLVITLSLFYLFTVVVFSAFYGRQYCNLICPVGTFLGLLSRFSVLKITIDKDKCNLCGACEKVCKAYCIGSKNMKLDFDRCVSCFNCLRVCPESGLNYKSIFNNINQSFSQERREIIVKSSALTISFIGLNSCTHTIPKKEAEKLNISQFPVIPPGAKSIQHFNDTCTACYTCVSACPTKVLQPTFLDFGWKGILQPKMDYWKSFCNYDCTKCTDVCPTRAILPLDISQKHLEQIGIAKFVKKDCVVETEKKDCGACAEHCPTKAVQMIPYGKLTIPEVTEEICIGCGACEFACPTKPKKAIYVEANTIHKKAKKPKTEKKKVINTKEFPF